MVTSEDRINQKLDAVQKTVNSILTTMAERFATDDMLRKRNDDTYKAVHGDGEHIGIKTKIYIIWGGLGLTFMLLAGFIFRHGF